MIKDKRMKVVETSKDGNAVYEVTDIPETLHAWKRSPLSERKAFYQLLVGLFRQELTTKRADL